MSLKTQIAAALSAALLLGAAPAAFAQAAGSVLVIDMEKLRAQSVAYADLQQKLNAEVKRKVDEFRTGAKGEADAIASEARALEPQVAGKTEQQISADPQLLTKVQNHMKRQQNLAQRQRLMELSAQATQARALQDLRRALTPVLTQLMQQRGANLVLEASTVEQFNPAVDITQDAITQFNASTKTASVTWTPVTIAPAESEEQAAAPAPAPKGKKK